MHIRSFRWQLNATGLLCSLVKSLATGSKHIKVLTVQIELTFYAYMDKYEEIIGKW